MLAESTLVKLTKQSNLVCQILGIGSFVETGPGRTVTNEELYKIARMETWSKTIQKRRLKWAGHLLRLDPSTPAQRSLKEALKPAKNKQLRKTTKQLDQPTYLGHQRH